ncbi:MgtC/SapB family protein [Fodinibius sediminis]|uniref:Putative Mg2+ transporter-C (MgtC) family protein n=1 Tax=Fodinibius sediminis TaxID=1214077 RepID=A0A521AGM6_9BACT|nr:MgtC/SapB family protein [Fodinibius sediminis]SMO33956.1 putative Mg2+ transporter-C (MgtC) family protein [Fodinibius sediminis]
MEFDLVWDPIVKVIFAMFLGGLMGLERELAQKPAGLRTHILVTGASSLLVVLGNVMIANYSGNAAFEGAIQADPIRIMEAIITGISFLGAGTIIFRNKDETVEGLTTAASILFSAAIGITVALQQYALASILTVLAIVILFGLGYIERFIKQVRRHIYEDKQND